MFLKIASIRWLLVHSLFLAFFIFKDDGIYKIPRFLGTAFNFCLGNQESCTFGQCTQGIYKWKDFSENKRKYHTVATTRFPGETAAPRHESYTSSEACKEKGACLLKGWKWQKSYEKRVKKDKNNIRWMNCYYEAYEQVLHLGIYRAKSSYALNYPTNI